MKTHENQSWKMLGTHRDKYRTLSRIEPYIGENRNITDNRVSQVKKHYYERHSN